MVNDLPAGEGHVTAVGIGPRGELLVGTEDEGLVCYDGQAKGGRGSVQVGETPDADVGGAPLGEDGVFALATDHQGRVWIGHGRTGVTVWNGKDFRHFGVGEGPLGERVFSIAVGPDGSVWMATSAGLTRYVERDGQGVWRHYTTAQGLPGLQAAKLAFGPNGKLYAAMQAAGLAIAGPQDDWGHFAAVEALPPGQVRPKTGQGLPSNLCNDVVVTPQGHVYVATCYGLARSLDEGKTFWYFRGFGFAEDQERAAGGAAPATDDAPDRSTPQPGAPTAPCIGHGALAEDFVAALSTDAAGGVFVAYRRESGQMLAPAGTDPAAPPKIAGRFENAQPTGMVQAPGGYVLLGQTLEAARLLDSGEAETPGQGVDPTGAALPPPAGPPGRAELAALLQAARAVPVDTQTGPLAVALEDDWATQGAFLGRHGKFLSVGAAMLGTADLVWGTGADRVPYSVTAPEGAMRWYIHELYTDNPSTLEMHLPYLDSRVQKKLTRWQIDRREAEWNDFGGGMYRAEDGPDMYVRMHVPPGLYVLSLYLHNKDGHAGDNAVRDYGLSVREAASGSYNTAGFGAQPELARGRGRQFWHGVYKQFLVRGPEDVQVQVQRNHSYLTIVAGAMLDEADEKSLGYFATREQRAAKLSEDEALRRELTGRKREAKPEPATAAAAADALLAELDTTRIINPRWWGQHRRVAYEALLRFYRGQPGAERKTATCCYYLGLFEEWERLLTVAGEKPPRTIERALRWDGKTDSSPGEDYELVRAYLAGANRSDSITPRKPRAARTS